MNLTAIIGGLEQGLIYSLVAIGLYISYKTLDIADLTTDGSFTLGAAASAMLCAVGHPVLGLLAAMLCGVLAGGVTALLQTKLRVPPILAGIITLTGLYSINLMVMGNSPNVSLSKSETVFTLLQPILGSFTKVAFSGGVLLIIAILLYKFMSTQLGLSIRATGNNRDMVTSSSINPAFTTTVGLCMANSFIALSGGILAQYQRFASVDIGNGLVIIGLASIIIGGAIFSRPSVAAGIYGAISGSVIYRLLLVVAISTSFISASNLKLATAILVALAISYPAIKAALELKRKRKAAR